MEAVLQLGGVQSGVGERDAGFEVLGDALPSRGARGAAAERVAKHDLSAGRYANRLAELLLELMAGARTSQTQRAVD